MHRQNEKEGLPHQIDVNDACDVYCTGVDESEDILSQHDDEQQQIGVEG